MRAPPAARPGKSQSGFALALALWMLAILSLMAGGYTFAMRSETLLIANRYLSLTSRGYAEAGIWLAIEDLHRSEPERQWARPGATHKTPFGDGSIEITIEDESGKIDLNGAPADLLDGLLKSAGLAGPDSLAMTHAILDWRDTDNEPEGDGAEDRDYEARGLPYGAKDGPFNTVDEIRRVLGMNEGLYRKIAPALTIHTQQSGLNPAVAPREALLAIPGTTENEVVRFLDEREGDETANFQSGGHTGGNRGSRMTIVSTGIYGNNKTRLRVTVNLARNQIRPYQILAWREW